MHNEIDDHIFMKHISLFGPRILDIIIILHFIYIYFKFY